MLAAVSIETEPAMFKHILIPTDGSPVAAKAIHAGVALAKEMGATVTGYYARSLVRGSAAAIAATQRSFVHNYQRPDDDLPFDSTRTALGGYSAQLSFSKRGGDMTIAITVAPIANP